MVDFIILKIEMEWLVIMGGKDYSISIYLWILDYSVCKMPWLLYYKKPDLLIYLLTMTYLDITIGNILGVKITWLYTIETALLSCIFTVL